MSYMVSPMSERTVEPTILLNQVSVLRQSRKIVNNITLALNPGQHWVILGANGCGKTTLLKVMSLYLHPSDGDTYINGQKLGSFDVRKVRPQIAYSSASLFADLRPGLSVEDVVVTAKYGALEPWWHEYTADDRTRARECLRQMSIDDMASRALGSLSSGEQQRVLLARTLMNDPIAVLLDEPSARLDLGGREQLVSLLDVFAQQNPQLPTAIVTHHVDEIPTSTTHVLMMRDGSAIAQGEISSVLTSAHLSATFGIDLHVEKRPTGRYSAYAV